MCNMCFSKQYITIIDVKCPYSAPPRGVLYCHCSRLLPCPSLYRKRKINVEQRQSHPEGCTEQNNDHVCTVYIVSSKCLCNWNLLKINNLGNLKGRKQSWTEEGMCSPIMCVYVFVQWMGSRWGKTTRAIDFERQAAPLRSLDLR